MTYYEYEYKVLEKLNELLKIESINITSEMHDAIKMVRNEHGILENKIVSRYISDDIIRLDFVNDFHYEFNRKILKEAYGQGYSEDFISRQIKEDIRSEYVNAFVEKKRISRGENI